ncbi:MAG: tetratricopeptide repeat protein [Azonexus sp.]
MLNAKLGLTAALLEINAWTGPLLFESNSDLVLFWYLAGHALASLLLATFVLALQPKERVRPRRATLLLLAGFSYAVPIAGFLCVLAGSLLLRFYKLAPASSGFDSLQLPDFDPHLRAQGVFRQAGLRAILNNSQVPMPTRLGAMVALQYVPGRVASPLLRDVLSDPAEDIRLLAYGMLDNQEKRINRAIDDELAQLDRASTDAARLAAAHRLSDLFWELVYQRLALGDLRQYAIDESLRYCEQVLAQQPASAAMILRRGRLRHEQRDYAAAEADYRQALALGLPATRVLPYLAEVRFEQRDFAGARRLVQELSAWNSLPRLRPIVDYWTRA